MMQHSVTFKDRHKTIGFGTASNSHNFMIMMVMTLGFDDFMVKMCIVLL